VVKVCLPDAYYSVTAEGSVQAAIDLRKAL